MAPKCEHPECPNEAYRNGVCDGHRILIVDDKHWVVICKKCGRCLRVAVRPTNRKTPKYIFAEKCRECGGTVEDEELINEKY